MNDAEKQEAVQNRQDAPFYVLLLAELFGRAFYCDNARYCTYKGKTYRIGAPYDL